MSDYYTGQRAKTYEAKRRGDPKWAWEYKTLDSILETINVKSVLDAPVGTGRLLKLFSGKVVGIDCSEDMLAIARKRSDTVELHKLDLLTDEWPGKANLVVCFRFLNLISEEEALLMLGKILTSAQKYAVFTLRTAPDTFTGKLSLGRVLIQRDSVMLAAIDELKFDVIERYAYKDPVPGSYDILLCKKRRKRRRRRNEAGNLVDYDPE